MLNGTVLNFGKRCEDDFYPLTKITLKRVIFDQWPKVHLGLDVHLSKESSTVSNIHNLDFKINNTIH